MNSLCARCLSNLKNAVHAKVRVCRQVTSDVIRFVCLAHVHVIRVRVRVHGNSLDLCDGVMEYNVWNMYYSAVVVWLEWVNGGAVE